MRRLETSQISRASPSGAHQRFPHRRPARRATARRCSYQFGNDTASSDQVAATGGADRINFYGKTRFVEQAYPSYRSSHESTNSLPGAGEGRETFDATLYTGVRLWQGGELQVNPEIDQGFGCAETRSGRVSKRRILQARRRLPGYNTDRGLVNVFAGRLHWPF
jgi:hypothetical protein